jgi:hypothetical protein
VCTECVNVGECTSVLGCGRDTDTDRKQEEEEDKGRQVDR